MKYYAIIFGVYALLMLSSCGSNLIEIIDPAVQAEEDSLIILDYIEELGLTGQDSLLEDGVRYVILDSGSGEFIDESDIVTFDFTGMLLTDTIFDTSIEAIGDSIFLAVQEDTTGYAAAGIEASNEQLGLLISFYEDRTYSPFELTYSSTGWSFAGNFISGFEDGIAATFRNMSVGGKALIVIPSGLAYGIVGSGLIIDPNTVIAFELYPTDVIKQP